ncbi:hypothetical protein K7X08_028590 [Anisodus acutangulus]|uniref:Uncharacterized protein n=1 Tax=Anisodus acutangulus TaxID=402998 RepID=A0A9Q1LX31_9SOLA|nr:hypothetical protein K7X08_028590 [Anisodus acutangulus]
MAKAEADRGLLVKVELPEKGIYVNRCRTLGTAANVIGVKGPVDDFPKLKSPEEVPSSNTKKLELACEGTPAAAIANAKAPNRRQSGQHTKAKGSGP